MGSTANMKLFNLQLGQISASAYDYQLIALLKLKSFIKFCVGISQFSRRSFASGDLLLQLSMLKFCTLYSILEHLCYGHTYS